MTASTAAITAADAQLANRQAGIAAAQAAARACVVGTDARTLEAWADAIIAASEGTTPTDRAAAARREREATREARRTALRIDHAARLIRPAVAGRAVPPAEVAEAWVAEILAPAADTRRRSAADRREATRLADKTRVRVTTVAPKDRKSKAAKAVAAHRARTEAIAQGAAQVLPTNAWPCFAEPTRSSLLLWDACKVWDDPNAALRFLAGR